MNSWKEFRDYYKKNPINYYEDMLGIKFTKFQKVKFKMYICLTDYLTKLLEEEKEILKCTTSMRNFRVSLKCFYYGEES